MSSIRRYEHGEFPRLSNPLPLLTHISGEIFKPRIPAHCANGIDDAYRLNNASTIDPNDPSKEVYGRCYRNALSQSQEVCANANDGKNHRSDRSKLKKDPLDPNRRLCKTCYGKALVLRQLQTYQCANASDGNEHKIYLSRGFNRDPIDKNKLLCNKCYTFACATLGLFCANSKDELHPITNSSLKVDPSNPNRLLCSACILKTNRLQFDPSLQS